MTMQEIRRKGARPDVLTRGRGNSLDPIERIAAEHAVQLELCDALEFIADGLPDRIDRRLIREVTGVLTHGVLGHFRFEENVLFPLLRERAGGDPSLVCALEQLEKEHGRDEDISHELAEELRLVEEQGRARNAEMLGYMLRGYFEGQRRHIEWENALILPLARKVLSKDDLKELVRSGG